VASTVALLLLFWWCYGCGCCCCGLSTPFRVNRAVLVPSCWPRSPRRRATRRCPRAGSLNTLNHISPSWPASGAARTRAPARAPIRTTPARSCAPGRGCWPPRAPRTRPPEEQVEPFHELHHGRGVVRLDQQRHDAAGRERERELPGRLHGAPVSARQWADTAPLDELDALWRPGQSAQHATLSPRCGCPARARRLRARARAAAEAARRCGATLRAVLTARAGEQTRAHEAGGQAALAAARPSELRALLPLQSRRRSRAQQRSGQPQQQASRLAGRC
jgi:hypothetical protein